MNEILNKLVFLARPQALSSIREPVIGGLNDYYISHMKLGEIQEEAFEVFM